MEISRPVAEVFAFVADQTNAPLWQNGLHEVRRLTEGPIGAGSQHEFIRRFAGRDIATRNRFVAFEEGHYVRFEIPEGWLTGQASYLTEPGPSGTVLTSRCSYKPTVSQPFWNPCSAGFSPGTHDGTRSASSDCSSAGRPHQAPDAATA